MLGSTRSPGRYPLRGASPKRLQSYRDSSSNRERRDSQEERHQLTWSGRSSKVHRMDLEDKDKTLNEVIHLQHQEDMVEVFRANLYQQLHQPTE